jgi:hypothetical protein
MKSYNINRDSCRVPKLMRLGGPKQGLMDKDNETDGEARQRY